MPKEKGLFSKSELRKNATQRVAERILEEKSYDTLCKNFKQKTLARAFAELTHYRPELLDKLMRQDAPIQGRRFLMDTDISYVLVPVVHKRLGPTWVLDHFLRQDASDAEMFYEATKHGITSIITNDHNKGDEEKDLCPIAQRAYDERKSDVGIIVVSQNVKTARAELNGNVPKVDQFLKKIARHGEGTKCILNLIGKSPLRNQDNALDL